MCDGSVVGGYFTDLLVEQEIVVELIAVKALDEAQRAQCVDYMKATGLRSGLLLNLVRHIWRSNGANRR